MGHQDESHQEKASMVMAATENHDDKVRNNAQNNFESGALEG
jgi:hypothetical protein